MIKEIEISKLSIRKIAEERLKINQASSPDLSLQDARSLIYELQVHQIELEIQNEELSNFQSELDDARTKYFNLYNLAPAGYLTVSDNGIILEANLTAAKLLDAAKVQLINQELTSFINFEDQDSYYFHRKKLFETGEKKEFELKMKGISGRMFHANFISSLVRKKDGIFYCNIIFSDISARIKAEEDLHDSEIKYRIFYEHGMIGMAIISPQKKWLHFNNQICQILGYSSDEIETKTWLDLTHYGDRELDENQFNRVLKNEINGYTIDKRFIQQNGNVVYTILSLQCVRNKDNTINYCVLMLQDITHRKIMEESLRESEELYHQLFEAETDAVFLIDHDSGKILEINNSAVVLYGYNRDEFLKMKIAGLSAEHYDNRKVNQGQYVVPVPNQVINISVFLHRKKDGSIFPVEITGRFFERHNRMVYISAVRDITERNRAEKELKKLNQHLFSEVEIAVKNAREKDTIMLQQSKNAAMGEMISNIAHQWRQPLNILGIIFQNTLAQAERDELNQQNIKIKSDKFMSTLNYLSQTIDDFRNFFKLDKEKTHFSIADSIRKSLVITEGMFNSSQIELQLDLDDSIKVLGYPNEFSQVLINLLNNARDSFIKKSVEPKIVKIKCFNEKKAAIVSIYDNGVTIPDDILPEIFNSNFTTKENGSGIGLYMSKIIINKSMNGTLQALNLSNGVEFRIEIPA